MDVRIPPLKHNIVLESDPLKSTMLARRLAVRAQWALAARRAASLCRPFLPDFLASCGLGSTREPGWEPRNNLFFLP